MPRDTCFHQSGRYGILEPAGLSGKYAFAKDLAERGYVTLAPAYAAVTEAGEPYNPYEHGYGSWMGGMAVWNHIRAIDLLQSLEEVDPKRIGAIGHSLGCFNTLYLAAFDSRVKVLACSAGVTSFEEHKTARDNAGKLTVWNQYDYFPRIETVYDRDPAKVPFDFSGGCRHHRAQANVYQRTAGRLHESAGRFGLREGSGPHLSVVRFTEDDHAGDAPGRACAAANGPTASVRIPGQGI
jgi:hypothetical protein